jgi:hypothetical protein
MEFFHRVQIRSGKERRRWETPQVWYFFFFFLAVLGFELWASHLLGRHYQLEPLCQSFFCVGYFWDRVLQFICPGWLQTVILLIAASREARITGMSHQYPPTVLFWKSTSQFVLF